MQNHIHKLKKIVAKPTVKLAEHEAMKNTYEFNLKMKDEIIETLAKENEKLKELQKAFAGRTNSNTVATSETIKTTETIPTTESDERTNTVEEKHGNEGQPIIVCLFTLLCLASLLPSPLILLPFIRFTSRVASNFTEYANSPQPTLNVPPSGEEEFSEEGWELLEKEEGSKESAKEGRNRSPSPSSPDARNNCQLDIETRQHLKLIKQKYLRKIQALKEQALACQKELKSSHEKVTLFAFSLADFA